MVSGLGFWHRAKGPTASHIMEGYPAGGSTLKTLGAKPCDGGLQQCRFI